LFITIKVLYICNVKQKQKLNIMITELTKTELNQTEVNLLLCLMTNKVKEGQEKEIKKTLIKLMDGSDHQSETYYSILNKFGI